MPTLDGFDVYHGTNLDQPFDWQRAVTEYGIRFGACKVSGSTMAGRMFMDSCSLPNRTGMKAAGLRWRGLYMWVTPDTPAYDQVDYFHGLVGDLEQGEFVFVDAEQTGLSDEDVLAALEAMEARYPGRVADYHGFYFPGGSAGADQPRYYRWPWIFPYWQPTMKVTTRPVCVWQYGGTQVFEIIKPVDSDQVCDPAALDRICGYPVDPVDPPTEESNMFDGCVKDDSEGHFWARGIDYDPARPAGQQWQQWACLIQELGIDWNLYQQPLIEVPLASLEAHHRLPVAPIQIAPPTGHIPSTFTGTVSGSLI